MMETSNMNYEERSLNTSKAVGQCGDQISLLDPIQEDPGNEFHEVPMIWQTILIIIKPVVLSVLMSWSNFMGAKPLNLGLN